MTVSHAFTSAGTTVSVSASAPATYDAAGFAALTYTQIGEITDAGTYGRKYSLVTHNPLDSRQTIKRKGSFNDGTMQLKLARVPSDAGQTILVAARDDDDSYSFKIVLQDGTINYFTAQVMSYDTMVGSVNQITGSQVDLELDNAVVEI
jgi:hypothetical protein